MIIGTAGHIDHGKTSLVRVLTGVETDRLKEEKARGISIDLGFAYLPDSEGEVLGFVDVPGHERFIHNMLAGATGIDFVLLVVAADDGIKPQTREHLAIIDLLGIESGIVAMTKIDLVDSVRQQEVTAEITDVLQSTRLADARIVPVSTATGAGIAELRAELLDIARKFGSRAANGRFRLSVDRSFTLTGAGTVLTGTVLSGAVAVDDRVTISPSGLSARVRSIHAQNRPSPRGTAGQRCALNIAGDGITKDAIARGDVVLDSVLHAPTARIDAELRWLSSEPKPVAQWMPARLFHAAVEVGARVVLLEDRAIAPGQTGLVQLVLEQPIAAASGDRFVLRDTTGQRTIGGGSLLDLRAPSRKRGTPARLAQLRAHALADPAAALDALLQIAPHYIELPGFARDRVLSDAQTQGLVAKLSLVTLETPGGVFAMAAPIHLAIRQTLLAKLQAFHADNPDLPGIGLERLRLQIEPKLPAPALLAILHGLVRGKEIALDGAWVRLAGHEVRLTDDDETLWARIAPLLAGAERFRPPRVRDIANALSVKEPSVRRLMKLLGRMGRVDEIAHDHFFLRATVAEMVGIVVSLGESEPHGEFTASQFRDSVDNGRKVAIQILEFFDRHGVTIRRGDLRRVNRHRLDLFRHSQDADPRPASVSGGESSLVGRPDFKSGRGRETVSGGFDSLSLPPR